MYAYHDPIILEDTHIQGDCDRAIDVNPNYSARRTPSVEYRSGAYSGHIKNEHLATIDSSVGSDPKTTPPTDCVTSAAEAYGGSSSPDNSDGSSGGTSEPAYEHTLAIQGDGRSTNYTFSVSDRLGESSDGDLEQWDSISGTSASGWVTTNSHRDTYRFTGEITSFSPQDGNVTVYLDGEQVDPATLAQ